MTMGKDPGGTHLWTEDSEIVPLFCIDVRISQIYLTTVFVWPTISVSKTIFSKTWVKETWEIFFLPHCTFLSFVTRTNTGNSPCFRRLDPLYLNSLPLWSSHVSDSYILRLFSGNTKREAANGEWTIIYSYLSYFETFKSLISKLYICWHWKFGDMCCKQMGWLPLTF